MVEFVNNPMELERSLNRYSYGQDCPAELADKLQTIPGSQADRIVEGTEILYAYRDELNEEGLTVLAQLTQYGIAMNWAVTPQFARWIGINALARSAIGEEIPAPEEAPEPKSAYRDGFDWRNPPETEDETP